MRASRSEKQAAQARGRAAEEAAAEHLAAKGFRILGHRVLTAGGELDLVAEDNGVLVFVEVKARKPGAKVGPLQAVDAAKRQRLVAAAQGYLAQLPSPWPACRFDVVALEAGEDGFSVRHLPDAFRPGD